MTWMGFSAPTTAGTTTPARLPGPRTPTGILANVERAKTGQALLYTMSDVRSHAPHDTGRDIIQAHMLAGPSEVSAKVGVLMRIPETMTDPLLRSLRLYTRHVPLKPGKGVHN